MNFTEAPFCILAVIVFALWFLCRRNYQAKVGLLLSGSLVFYSYHLVHRHQWHLLLLILAYCVANWLVARRLESSRRPRMVLALGVAFNLAVLGYWKYTPMLLRTAARLTLALDLPLQPAVAAEDWVIPFGISFYAFTGIAYMVDVYRGATAAERSLLPYALSVMFFPHLVAGPILRPGDFLNKLRPETMPDQTEAPLEAISLLARGFFKKLVLANRIALAVDPFFLHLGDASTAGVWALPYTYLYAFQIYFDFSGYTDIARGLALLFGFRWPDNFHWPYLAGSIQEFWRRWHITLSLFLRDYLYIPLGGSRRGTWRTNLNLMLTMLLGGLWHGASWSFMLWGGLHGTYLLLNRHWYACLWRKRLAVRLPTLRPVGRILSIALTFHCVCLAWCFFRLNLLANSLACVRGWIVFDPNRILVGGTADLSLWLLLGLYALIAGVAHVGMKRLQAIPKGVRPLESQRESDPFWGSGKMIGPLVRGFQWGFAVMLLTLAVLLAPVGEKPPFIYFQF
jgi:D-alanyl-lipoteichoic acid acyltransferase DltB (MBOAT superfamily)